MGLNNTFFNLNLSWLNTLGGWEFFNFQARKSYGYDVRNISQIERDVFSGWDSNYIAGEGGREDLINEARETLTVRSQQLTKDQIEAIARIRFSRKVYDMTNPYKPITVIVDKGSFQYYTDADKRRVIEFNITYPKMQIQVG